MNSDILHPTQLPITPTPPVQLELDFDSDVPLDIGWDGSCDLGCESCQ